MNKSALLRLAKMYDEGLGVEQNYDTAFDYYNNAQQMGDSTIAAARKKQLLEEGLVKEEDHIIYEVVEKNASFPGGANALNAYLSKNMKYPKKAQEMGIQGIVYVQFVVDTDGSIIAPQVIRSPDPSLSKEALRIIKMMPKWEPASQGGKKVRSRFNAPIKFSLH